MEGYNPQRNRATTAHLAPPLKLAQALLIGRNSLVGSPVVAAHDLLLVEENHQLHAVTYEGEARWAATLPGSFLSPAVAGNTIFVRAESGEEGYLVALQAGSGENLWQFKFPEVGSSYGNMGGHVTSPVVVEGLVLVGAGRSFYAFKTNTGHIAWTFQLAEPISSSVAVAGKTVFFTDFKQL
jgi:outer membrane protein assembly factor BamB